MANANSPAAAVARGPANRLGLDYRRPTGLRALGAALVDVHTHVHVSKTTATFIEAARMYGVGRIFSMSAVGEVEQLAAAHGDILRFIAVPNWKAIGQSDAFAASWMHDLGVFRSHGAALCKFWMAPPMRERHGLTLEHPFLAPIIAEALRLGFDFLLHVGDPSVWWRPGGKYADTARFGTKADQYAQLRWFCRRVAPRFVIAAHMGGNIEDPDFLQGLLDELPNLYLDTSAAKWIVREVARQPERAAAFVRRNSDRILFGSDVVVEDKYDFDHYASRYWAQRTMWETAYAGESPIDDPDAEGPPQLAGLNLPDAILQRVYRDNAARLGLD